MFDLFCTFCLVRPRSSAACVRLDIDNACPRQTRRRHSAPDRTKSAGIIGWCSTIRARSEKLLSYKSFLDVMVVIFESPRCERRQIWENGPRCDGLDARFKDWRVSFRPSPSTRLLPPCCLSLQQHCSIKSYPGQQYRIRSEKRLLFFKFQEPLKY